MTPTWNRKYVPQLAKAASVIGGSILTPQRKQSGLAHGHREDVVIEAGHDMWLESRAGEECCAPELLHPAAAGVAQWLWGKPNQSKTPTAILVKSTASS